MTNGITNVVGSQSYNCRLYSCVSLMSTLGTTPLTKKFSSDMFRNDFYAGRRGNNQVCSFLVAFLSIGNSARNQPTNQLELDVLFIAQPAFSILLSINYSPQLTSQSFFAIFQATQHKGKGQRLLPSSSTSPEYHGINELGHTKCSLATFCASCLDQGARRLRGRPIFVLLVLHSVHQDVLQGGHLARQPRHLVGELVGEGSWWGGHLLPLP